MGKGVRRELGFSRPAEKQHALLGASVAALCSHSETWSAAMPQ